MLRIVGTDRAVSLKEVAGAAYVLSQTWHPLEKFAISGEKLAPS
jgi:hypothetical protein